MFTSIIEFTVPRTPSFSIHLLEKGSEGSAYGISLKEKPPGHLSQSTSSDHRRAIEIKNCDAHAGYTNPVMNVGLEPRTDMFDKSFSSLMPPR